MLPCLALLLLMELSVCTVAGDGEVELCPKAETWRPLIQPRRKKGREDEAQGSE
uniref:Uncharacterized protein n=1 Tax=Cercocebus atys TaxID=9531 RepID=A0A2K5MF43_CERAT